MTRPMQVNVPSPGGPVLEDYYRTLNPKIASVDYQFGSITGLPTVWGGPFDSSVSWVDADPYETALVNFSTALNLEKSYVLLQQAFSGENHPKQTLQYYLLIVEQQGSSDPQVTNYDKYDLLFINNRDSLDKKYT
eukprot:UN01569